MKEATGELNLAVVVAIAVGILVAFFFTVLWPMIKGNFQQTENCRQALCDCANAKSNDYKCTCWMKGNKGKTFYCPWEG